MAQLEREGSYPTPFPLSAQFCCLAPGGGGGGSRVAHLSAGSAGGWADGWRRCLGPKCGVFDES